MQFSNGIEGTRMNTSTQRHCICDVLAAKKWLVKEFRNEIQVAQMAQHNVLSLAVIYSCSFNNVLLCVISNDVYSSTMILRF